MSQVQSRRLQKVMYQSQQQLLCNSVALGTDTSGNYIHISAGTGVSISSVKVLVSIGQSVATSSNVHI